MLENSSSDSFAHVRESAFWVTTIEQALRQYELTLASSAHLSHLLDSQSSAPCFIDQRLCSHAWDEAVRISEDPLFGLRIHRVFAPTAYAALALAAAASPRMEDAVALLERFFSIFSTQLKLVSRAAEGKLHLTLQPVGNPHYQHTDAVLGYLSRFFNRLDVGSQGLLQQLQIPGCADEHIARQLFHRNEVVFGGPHTLVLDQALVRQPLPSASPFILPKLVAALEPMQAALPSHALTEQVRRRIHLLLGSGDISAERVAEPLNISPRHLRRKLSQEGTSYEQLADEVRREAAIRLIVDGQMSLTSIAYELGFLDPSSFTRAFRRWTNMSPTAYRRELSRSKGD